MKNYINFDLAMMLKNVGYNEPCTSVWVCDKEVNNTQYKMSLYDSPFMPINLKLKCFIDNNDIPEIIKHNMWGNKDIQICLCPTIQDVREWLEKIHKIMINITYCHITNDSLHPSFGWNIVLIDKSNHVIYGEYNEYTRIEAIEKAMHYCLNHLVKPDNDEFDEYCERNKIYENPAFKALAEQYGFNKNAIPIELKTWIKSIIEEVKNNN